jgi:ribosome production factor 1
MKELERVIPNSEYFLRRKSTIKKMVEQAVGKGFTDIIVVNEDQKEPSKI